MTEVSLGKKISGAQTGAGKGLSSHVGVAMGRALGRVCVQMVRGRWRWPRREPREAICEKWGWPESQVVCGAQVQENIHLCRLNF